MGCGLVDTLGALGGAVGSNIFLSEQRPHYWLGYGFSIGTLVVAIASTLVLRMTSLNINKRRDQIPVEEVKQKYTEGMSPMRIRLQYSFFCVEQLLDMGDRSPLYRYVL